MVVSFIRDTSQNNLTIYVIVYTESISQDLSFYLFAPDSITLPFLQQILAIKLANIEIEPFPFFIGIALQESVSKDCLTQAQALF
jgi:hypothetical protein